MLGNSNWSPVITDPRDFEALDKRFKENGTGAGHAVTTALLIEQIASIKGIVPVWSAVNPDGLHVIMAVNEEGLRFLHSRFYIWKQETVYPLGYEGKEQLPVVSADLPNVELSTTLLTRGFDEMIDDGRTFWIGWKWEATFLNEHSRQDLQDHIAWMMKQFIVDEK